MPVIPSPVDGVDLQVVSSTPVLFAYGRPAGQAMECARIFNDSLLELCAAGRGRLVAQVRGKKLAKD